MDASPPRGIWDSRNTAELKRLWGVGCTLKQIADDLSLATGTCFTVGMISGKADRLGLPKRYGWWGPRHKSDLFADFVDLETRRKSSHPAPDPSLRCTLDELTWSKCRFPHGEPGREDFLYCGAPREGGRGFYCPHCSDIAFVATEEEATESWLKFVEAGNE